MLLDKDALRAPLPTNSLALEIIFYIKPFKTQTHLASHALLIFKCFGTVALNILEDIAFFLEHVFRNLGDALVPL